MRDSKLVKGSVTRKKLPEAAAVRPKDDPELPIPTRIGCEKPGKVIPVRTTIGCGKPHKKTPPVKPPAKKSPAKKK